ncbi:MAG: dihydropteroate synthase [Acidobacteriota bacterium]
MKVWSYALPAANTRLELPSEGRPKVMGVLNVTPDSFSDGGLYFDAGAAIRRGLEMAADGAEILDLGAESTRPGGGVYGSGMADVATDEEIRRLEPVLRTLRAELPHLPLSVDTRKGAVARAALDLGADLVNDVGGLRDPSLVAAAAATAAPVIAMHSRGELASMQREIHFEDAVGEVKAELAEALERAVAGGVPRDSVILDPGIGFGKNLEHNLALIGGLRRLGELGQPLLLGASRKSFIAAVRNAPPDQRLGGSLAALAFAALDGAQIVRVHDVAPSRQFLEVLNAIDSTRA